MIHPRGIAPSWCSYVTVIVPCNMGGWCGATMRGRPTQMIIIPKWLALCQCHAHPCHGPTAPLRPGGGAIPLPAQGGKGIFLNRRYPNPFLVGVTLHFCSILERGLWAGSRKTCSNLERQVRQREPPGRRPR